MAMFDTWDEERFPGFQEHMKQLYDQSFACFQNQESSTKEKDEEALKHLFGYLERYFVSFLKLGYVSKETFPVALEQMKKIRLLSILEERLRKKFNGLTYQYVIAMNPTPGCYLDLDEEASLQFAFYHEIGHILTACNADDIDHLVSCIDSGGHEEDIKRGFELLDEVVVQNIAEDVFYDQRGEARPEAKPVKNSLLYPNGEFTSNFSAYPELHDIAGRFSRCLGFLNLKEDDSLDTVTKRLCQAMLSRSFCYRFFQELAMNPERMKDFEEMLIAMGRMKDAKYTTFGYGQTQKNQLDMTESIANFQVLVEKNKVVFVKEEEKVQS